MTKSVIEDREKILKKYEIKSYTSIKKNKHPLEVRKQRGYQLEAISSQAFVPSKVRFGY